MDILEILYAREFKKFTFNVRKVFIDDKKVVLSGPRGSGKSSLIYDYLCMKDKGTFLYIDLQDFRLKDYYVGENLSDFIKQKHIKLLVIENFDFSFPLPPCDEIILTTVEDRVFDGFTHIKIYPLDFEEFISFGKREINIESIFNSYVSCGTFPAMFGLTKDNLTKVYQQFLLTIVKNEQELMILKYLSSKQGEVISLYKIYKHLKDRMKISKDSFYDCIKRFEDQKIIFLVDKFGLKRGTKKVYMIDFIIKGVLNFEKDFIKRFENIIFLELIKREKKIYYTDAFEIYIPDEKKAILSIPFFPIEVIKEKLRRLKGYFLEFGVKNVQVVTMEISDIFVENGINFEVIPFVNFATSL